MRGLSSALEIMRLKKLALMSIGIALAGSLAGAMSFFDGSETAVSRDAALQFAKSA